MAAKKGKKVRTDRKARSWFQKQLKKSVEADREILEALD